ncbi:MAG: hypothetical protein GXX96_37680 [Planctomycetaceae bacterium]|nr:hypothetical protein [Planctomycetaceae bacterium]
MTFNCEPLESVGDIWIALAACLLSLGLLVFLSIRTNRRYRSLRRLGREESGAGYSIAMVITMPIYAVLICMIVECTLLLQVKIGTTYAAYAAARSAAVWYPAEISQTKIDAKVKTAAVHALTPFASSRSVHLQAIAAGNGSDVPDRDELYAAYAAYCGGPISSSCLADKFAYAWHSVDVAVSESTPGANANLTVTVTYKMPFHTAIGYSLGGHASSCGLCLREIRTTVTLQKEGVKSPTQKLGINYDPDHDS